MVLIDLWLFLDNELVVGSLTAESRRRQGLGRKEHGSSWVLRFDF